MTIDPTPSATANPVENETVTPARTATAPAPSTRRRTRSSRLSTPAPAASTWRAFTADALPSHQEYPTAGAAAQQGESGGSASLPSRASWMRIGPPSRQSTGGPHTALSWSLQVLRGGDKGHDREPARSWRGRREDGRVARLQAARILVGVRRARRRLPVGGA